MQRTKIACSTTWPVNIYERLYIYLISCVMSTSSKVIKYSQPINQCMLFMILHLFHVSNVDMERNTAKTTKFAAKGSNPSSSCCTICILSVAMYSHAMFCADR